MSHNTCRGPSKDRNDTNLWNKRTKEKNKSCCSVENIPMNCKCLHFGNKRTGQQKPKRLKTRRERMLIRVQNEVKPRHHYCSHHNRDMAHYHNCCHSANHCSYRKGSMFASVLPAAQEPSVITHSRLTGHHGLFNREVKSGNIERLLSEQKKRERTQACIKQWDHGRFQMSSDSTNPSPFSNEGLLVPTNDASPFLKPGDSSSKACNDSKGKGKGSCDFVKKELEIDIEDAREQLHEISPGSLKSTISTKIRSTKKKSSIDGMGNNGESQVTPIVGTCIRKSLKTKAKNLITPDQNYNSLNSPVCQTLTKGPRPSTSLLSSSPGAPDNFDAQHIEKDPEHVSKCISAVAARLCDSLRFPLLKRKSLVSKTREMLMKSLHEHHGPWLQENLVELQTQCSFPLNAVQNEDEGDADFRKNWTNNKNLHWSFSQESSPNLHQSIHKMLTSPAEACGNISEEIITTSAYSRFCIETDSRQALDGEGVASFPRMSQEETMSSHPYRERSNVSHSQFDSFGSVSVKHTKAYRGQSAGQLANEINASPVLPEAAQLSGKWSTEPMLTRSDSLPFAQSFPAQIPHALRSRRSSGFNLSAFSPAKFMSNNIEMHFPSSHTLRVSPAQPSSVLLSPEHWSFPPMRLY